MVGRRRISNPTPEPFGSPHLFAFELDTERQRGHVEEEKVGAATEHKVGAAAGTARGKNTTLHRGTIGHRLIRVDGLYVQKEQRGEGKSL